MGGRPGRGGGARTKLGLLTSCMPERSLEDIAAWAGAHGYDRLEIAAWPRETAGRSPPAISPSKAEAERVRSLLDGHGLAVSALAHYPNDVSPDRRHRYGSAMRKGLTTGYSALAWLALALGVLQFFLAGLGVFGASSYSAHATVGFIFHTVAVVVFLLALAGPRTGRDIGMGLLFAVLATVQIYLPELRDDAPEVAAVHPLLALILLGLASHIGSRYLGRGRGADRGSPAAA